MSWSSAFDYNWMDKWLIFLLLGPGVQASNVIQVFVKTLTGKTLTIRIPQGATVLQLKKLILKEEGISEDQQRIIFAGRQLGEDDRTLEWYRIQDESTLHLVFEITIMQSMSF